MCRIQAYKHYPCPRVGYPALGAGHARERGSVHSIRTIAVQSLADNLYADVINFCSSAAPGLFHDLVAPVVRLTTDSNAYKVQEGSFTRTISSFSRSSMQPLTMHGLECVGFFALPFILLSFYFILFYFNIYFYVTLL